MVINPPNLPPVNQLVLHVSQQEASSRKKGERKVSIIQLTAHFLLKWKCENCSSHLNYIFVGIWKPCQKNPSKISFKKFLTSFFDEALLAYTTIVPSVFCQGERSTEGDPTLDLEWSTQRRSFDERLIESGTQSRKSDLSKRACSWFVATWSPCQGKRDF